LIFLISGMAALTYEVVWVRMLSLIFGTTTFAVSTVLFAFMAGQALGSYFFGKIIDSARSPLRLYALLELGIGVYAVFVPYNIDALNTAYVSSFDENIPNFLVYSLIRFAFSMAVLLVPTTLMGGTLPVISRYFVRNLGTVGWDVGILYTINTLGAVAGVLLAGFLSGSDLWHQDVHIHGCLGEHDDRSCGLVSGGPGKDRRGRSSGAWQRAGGVGSHW